MKNKIHHVIFIYESWKLNEDFFIFLSQVIAFLNLDKFNQLPTDLPQHLFLIREREKKSYVLSLFSLSG